MTDPVRKIIVAFDLYGTLLSTESIAKELAEHFGTEKAQSIALLWRRYQLEYTWRLNSMGQYQPFSDITRSSLRHALSDSGESLSTEAIEALMKAYDSLSSFPDVIPALEALAKHPHIVPVVFSNGTSSMVTNSVNHSPDLSPISKIFQKIVVVESVKKFKPAPEVYRHLTKVVGKSVHQTGDIWLVSGNPFDVVGARSIGMQAAWVDRAGKGWTDRLLDHDVLGPTAIVRGLGEVIEAISRHA
ncbi:MAG: hypothetical protein M4579_002050 [Chaenotheca gracillima]|nr:MAG: hypothetical protein M4579_002050 [Chaenotheca gracillima]